MAEFKITECYSKDLTIDKNGVYNYDIPDFVTQIGKYFLFHAVESKTMQTKNPITISINIPESVKKIESEAFYIWNKECIIKDLIIPMSVTEISRKSFCNVQSIVLTEKHPLIKKKHAFVTVSGSILTVKFSDSEKEYQIITNNLDTPIVIEGETKKLHLSRTVARASVTDSDVTIYNGYEYTGTFFPRKRRNRFVAIIEENVSGTKFSPYTRNLVYSAKTMDDLKSVLKENDINI